MTKRIKKPSVKPEVRRIWLKRNEEDGESPPQIAAKDGFDVRTVRKQIELAKQEREGREARSAVLRNALEEHYHDLCRYAEYLSHSVLSEGKIYVEGGFLSPNLDIAHMNAALRQHLPRSPIWKDLTRLGQLNGKLAELEADVKRRIGYEIRQDLKPEKISANCENLAIIESIAAVLAFQVKAWAQGHEGLSICENFKVKPVGEGWVSVEYGFAHMGKIVEQHVQDIKDVLIDFEHRIGDWEQLDSMRKLFTELGRVKSSLQDELAVIIHRRIVSGRCRYCPL